MLGLLVRPIATALLAVPLVAAHGAPTRRVPVAAPAAAATDTAVFAGGCFWGVEAVFEHLKGVTSAVSGYAGGQTATPSYDEVSTGTTGYAESVRVVYDPTKISYTQLLNVFFTVAHDPTELNRQGPDRGTQYRSALFVRGDVQRRQAEAFVAQLTEKHAFPRPIVTQIAPLTAFHEAEAYHQDYLAHHPDSPYIVINDAPKVARLQQVFPALYRD